MAIEKVTDAQYQLAECYKEEEVLWNITHTDYQNRLTLTLSWVWWGMCEGGRKGGWSKKARAACPPGPGLEPGTCRVLGKDPQLHAMGVV